MNDNEGIVYLENSFLMNLLVDKDITDITYNGVSIYYLHNFQGRRKSDINIDLETARSFIRQLANISEKQFSLSSPNLDITLGKYRINAVHQSIGRVGNDPAITFAIRIASDIPKITDDSNFLNAPLVQLFHILVRSGVSIVIGGATGSGKTEFQKYLISIMEENARVIAIDNVLELNAKERYSHLDMNCWLADDNNQNTSIQQLVKNALRSNPDWLIVAEARGKEMLEVLNSAMTGHPIITTIHALDVESMPSRMARMVMMNEKKMDYDDVLKDIFYHFPFYIYLKRDIDEDGQVRRYISSISYADKTGAMNAIYREEDKDKYYRPMDEEIIKKLCYQDDDTYFIKYFLGGKK